MNQTPPPPPSGRSPSPAGAGAERVNLFTDGKAYERLMGRWSQVAGAQFLDWLAPPKGLHWIDVGCGNGAFTEVLIQRCNPSAVTAVDPSEGQLAYARTRPGTKLAEFRLADAQSLPFPDDSFDSATMALVITFIPDALKAVREMRRVVRPGGIVATYMWDFHGGGFPFRPIGIAMEALNLPPPVAPNPDASRRDAMQSFWTKAGLEAIETRVIKVRTAYANLDEFWEICTIPIGTYGTAIAALPQSQRDQLKAKLHEQLPAAADGSIVYEAFANAVKGRVSK